jgi:hypothetical protein
MFKDARQNKFDILLFWSLDRFTREGLFKTITYLQLLDSYGIVFHSYSEEYLNTENETEFSQDQVAPFSLSWSYLVSGGKSLAFLVETVPFLLFQIINPTCQPLM